MSTPKKCWFSPPSHPLLVTCLVCIQKPSGLVEANVMFYTQPVKERFICLGVVKLGTPRGSEVDFAYQLSHLAAVLFMALLESKFQDLWSRGVIIPCAVGHK